jgi:hypothetical protein
MATGTTVHLSPIVMLKMRKYGPNIRIVYASLLRLIVIRKAEKAERSL